MNIIKLQVKNFEIIPLEKQYVVENQVNEFAIEFEFDDSWNYETKYVIFDNEETTYKRPIINNQVIIPSELLNGRTTIQIYGQNVENGEIVKRKPSYKYSFSILNSLSTEGQEESDLPTPSQWELYISQIEEMCNGLQNQFDDLKEECETKCNDVIERLTQDEQDIQTNTDNIKANAEAIDALNTSLLDYSLITETGNKISMSINPNTYVITLSLKDKNDNILSTQSVDLPLETMIVSASYSNGILTFTLKNGQTLQVPISDLINGLVSTDTFNQTVQGLSNRITAIENDYLKSTDKTELQNQITANADDISDIKGEQLTQNADIESLQQENERLSRIVSGLPTKNASGTNIILNDMVNCEIKEISLKGDNLQVSDNKMITTNQNYYINGTATAYGKGGNNTGVAIPIIPGAPYTIKATTTLSRYRIGTTATLGDSGSLNNGAIYDGTSTTATITSNDSYLIINANDLTKINITTSTPTPSSPIEIQSVKGNQTIQCCGKNLCGIKNILTANYKGVNITLQDGYILLNGTVNEESAINIDNSLENVLLNKATYRLTLFVESGTIANGNVRFYIKDNDVEINSVSNVSLSETKTLSYKHTTNRIGLYLNNGVTFNNYKVKLLLTLGSDEQSTYENFISSTQFPISLGNIELNKIGDYQDKIYKSNDKWYLEKNVGKYTAIESTGNWYLSGANHCFKTLLVNTPISNMAPYNFDNSLNIGAFNRLLKQALPNDLYLGNEGNAFGLSNTQSVGVYFNIYGIDTREDFINWLNTNQPVIYYAYATPVITEITDDNLINQLEALNNYILLTNNTIISNGNLPVINDITGYVDIMSLISSQDNRSIVEEKKVVTKPIEEPIEEPIETKKDER